VDGADVATVMGLAAELRRGAARRWRLPSLNRGHWLAQGVAGKIVMLLRWQMGGSARACARLWRRRSCGSSATATGVVNDEGGAGKLKMGRGMARAGAGGVKAAARHSVACAIRAFVMRGRRHGHTACVLYRWSATDNVDQFVSVNHTEPDDACSR